MQVTVTRPFPSLGASRCVRLWVQRVCFCLACRHCWKEWWRGQTRLPGQSPRRHVANACQAVDRPSCPKIVCRGCRTWRPLRWWCWMSSRGLDHLTATLDRLWQMTLSLPRRRSAPGSTICPRDHFPAADPAFASVAEAAARLSVAESVLDSDNTAAQSFCCC